MQPGLLAAPYGALQHRQRRKRGGLNTRHLAVSLRLAAEHFATQSRFQYSVRKLELLPRTLIALPLNTRMPSTRNRVVAAHTEMRLPCIFHAEGKRIELSPLPMAQFSRLVAHHGRYPPLSYLLRAARISSSRCLRNWSDGATKMQSAFGSPSSCMNRG